MFPVTPVLDSAPVVSVPAPLHPVGEHGLDHSKLRHDLGRAVARMCPAWPAAVRDEAVHVAVRRVADTLSTHALDGEGNRAIAASHLYKVAHSAIVNEIRRVTRRGEAEVEEHGGTEVGRVICECLLRMSQDRRLAVTLYLQGHTVPEAAGVLDWPVKRTENLVHLGLAELRRFLSNQGTEP